MIAGEGNRYPDPGEGTIKYQRLIDDSLIFFPDVFPRSSVEQD
jgi:hypothetical protein